MKGRWRQAKDGEAWKWWEAGRRHRGIKSAELRTHDKLSSAREIYHIAIEFYYTNFLTIYFFATNGSHPLSPNQQKASDLLMTALYFSLPTSTLLITDVQAERRKAACRAFIPLFFSKSARSFITFLPLGRERDWEDGGCSGSTRVRAPYLVRSSNNPPEALMYVL
jgi:hypothetical protein